MKHTISVVIPCYNEERTIETCVENVRTIADEHLAVEIIIVDDASTDSSLKIAKKLSERYPEVIVLNHTVNQGKGASLRTGFKTISGQYVVVQDADLEYKPKEIKRLLVPLIEGEADVVIGSRFLTSGPHRVLYFWHSLGNRFLTLLSNMFTDLNLTDMETCYKVFRSDVLKDIEIEEDRFGFEPEIIAKVAQKRLRIYEMGISYFGRTYEEGKKIGVKDGFRALYCIFRYNAHKAPLPMQLLIYFLIGSVSAVFNFVLFLILLTAYDNVNIAAPTAFILAGILNYFLSTAVLFRRKVKWGTKTEIMIYSLVVVSIAFIDLEFTKLFLAIGVSPGYSKIAASFLALILNFIGRKYIVFPEKKRGPWEPQKKELLSDASTNKQIFASRNIKNHVNK